MKLCLHCVQVGIHAPGCPEATAEDGPPPADPDAKHERVTAIMERVKKILEDGEERLAASPREALELSFVAQETLARAPAGDLKAFDTRRAHNDLTKAVARFREKAGDALPKEQADRILADLAYAKKALEGLGEVAKRRREAATFELTALGKLPRARVNYAREEAQALDGVCQEIETRIKESVAIEADVEAWGTANIPALVRGGDPAMVPRAKTPSLTGPLVAGAVGTLILLGGIADGVTNGWAPRAIGIAAAGAVVVAAGGAALVGKLKRKAALPGEFKELGVRFCERVYLSAALRILRRRTSRRERAEEAFRKLTTGEAGALWKRIRTDDKEAVKFFFDWDGKRPLEDTLSRAVAEKVGRRGRLRAMEDMNVDEWDALGKAFALDLFGGGGADEAQRFDAIAPMIAEGEVEASEIAVAKKAALDAWSQGGERRRTQRFTGVT